METERAAPAEAGGRRGWWAAGVEALASLVLPWECPVCGAENDGDGDGDGEADARPGRRPSPFCGDCRGELLDAAGPACVRCAMPVGPWVRTRTGRKGGCRECRGRGLGFDEAVALGSYHGPLRELCLRLKHRPDGWLARWVAELLAEARPALAAEASRSPGALVVPVPLHWRRRWERGYNQSEELARGLARRLGLRLAQPLRRVRHTDILAGLGRTERAQRLRDAFRTRSTPLARPESLLKGRTVLLVDDILTTGATCGAAARALKRGGASRVVAVVVGRAEGRA